MIQAELVIQSQKKLESSGKVLTIMIYFLNIIFTFDTVDSKKIITENNANIFTALDTVRVLLDVLEETTLTISTIDA